MKLQLGLLLSFFAVTLSADCSVDQETKCADDFARALPYCKKAAQAQGKDFDADKNCMIYSFTMEQDCWPCVCFIAQK